MQIDVVDPRNQLFLIPSLIADFKRFKPPLRSFLKTLLLGISPSSIIINGTKRYSGELPKPEELVAAVGVEMGAMPRSQES